MNFTNVDRAMLAITIGIPFILGFYLPKDPLFLMLKILSYISLINVIIIVTSPLFLKDRGILDATTSWNALLTYGTGGVINFIQNDTTTLTDFFGNK